MWAWSSRFSGAVGVLFDLQDSTATADGMTLSALAPGNLGNMGKRGRVGQAFDMGGAPFGVSFFKGCGLSLCRPPLICLGLHGTPHGVPQEHVGLGLVSPPIAL
jgi:hypothetical protein